MAMRLQKFISYAGYASRRMGEQLIREGRVRVNGIIALEPGIKIDPDKDRVFIDNKLLTIETKRLYFAFYKPKGVITTNKDPFGRMTIIKFLNDYMRRNKRLEYLPRIYHIGRLDKDSEGLLLLTNDGYLTNLLLHPSHKIEKEYWVTVRGLPKRRKIRQLERGIEIYGQKTMPCRITFLKTIKGGDSIFRVILREGKKRQIRYMFQSIGHPVKRLVRRRIGPITLSNLSSGSIRPLKKWEIQALKQYTVK